MWKRHIRVYFCTTLHANVLLTVLYVLSKYLHRSNWSALTLTVSTLGAVGGILVAATLKYADAILKTLATAGSIVISTICGHFLLQGIIIHLSSF